MTAGFRHTGERELLSLHRIRVVRASFEAPDGESFERDVVRDKAVVAMVPVLADGRTVVLVRQYRGAVDHEVLEIPAGLCDVEGEDDPRATAARELVEEVGMVADDLDELAHIHQSPGISDEHAWVYLATGLHEVAHDRQGPEEQHMSVVEVALDEVPAMIADGRLTDAKTIIGLLLARDRLAR